MSSSTSSQVLIAGSGPAGLVLALALLQNGVPVRILEKSTEHHNSERGAGVQPRTLEIERFLGLGEEVQRAGLGLPRMKIFNPNDPYRIVKSFEMMEKIAPTPAFPITEQVLIGQWLHQQILRKHLEQFGCLVELGCALATFEQQEDGVIAHLVKTKDGVQSEETAKFAYIVGADGADGACSTVRKSLGINFVGETRDTRIYLVDARIEGMPEVGKDFYKWEDNRIVVASLRYTTRPGIFQMVLAGLDLDFDALKTGSVDAIQSAFHALTGRQDLKVTEIISHGEWRLNMRIAERFSVVRVFIVGDAAHVHPPSGGQGLNSSIQDSFNLAWKLALALKSRASTSLLDSFESERLPVIAEMLNITTELFNKLVSRTETQQALETAQTQSRASETEKTEEKDRDREAWTRDRKLLQLELNYRWSNIVYDERFAKDVEGGEKAGRSAYGITGHDLCAGDRAPDASGLSHIGPNAIAAERIISRIFDVFSTSVHTVLVFPSNTSDPTLIPALLAPISNFSKDLVQTAIILPRGSSNAGIASSSSSVDYVFCDDGGHAYKGYGLDSSAEVTTVVIVRPDAMIGAFAQSAAGIEKYFSLVFA